MKCVPRIGFEGARLQPDRLSREDIRAFGRAQEMRNETEPRPNGKITNYQLQITNPRA
jgi:hypothetical protein